MVDGPIVSNLAQFRLWGGQSGMSCSRKSLTTDACALGTGQKG